MLVSLMMVMVTIMMVDHLGNKDQMVTQIPFIIAREALRSGQLKVA